MIEYYIKKLLEIGSWSYRKLYKVLFIFNIENVIGCLLIFL